MRDDRRNYVAAGAFVIAMLAAALLWLAALAGRTGASDDYYVVYGNVMGLSPGTQVLYQGFPIGVIDDISPVEDAGRRRFRVDLAVRRGWRIPADSTAQITASGLLAAVVVDIRGGEDARQLEPGDRIASHEAPGVFETVTTVADELQMLSRDSLRPLLDSLAQRAPEILGNLEAVSVEAGEAVRRINALVTPENARRVEAILARLERTTGNVETLSREFETTRARLDELIGAAARLTTGSERELEHAVGDLHHALEIVAQHVEAIARNLEAATRNASEFSRQIRGDPSLLLRGREPADAAQAE